MDRAVEKRMVRALLASMGIPESEMPEVSPDNVLRAMADKVPDGHGQIAAMMALDAWAMDAKYGTRGERSPQIASKAREGGEATQG